MDVVLTAALAIVFLYVLSGLRVFKEYERGVLFVLGRSWGAKGPGLRFLPPLLTKVQTVSLRVVAMDVPPQDEAERERRAKVINAEGELQASEKLAQAARIIGAEPAAIQLRYLQTVTEISSENNSTTFFPIPIDLFKGFLDAVSRKPVTPALPETTSGETLPAELKKSKAGA